MTHRGKQRFNRVSTFACPPRQNSQQLFSDTLKCLSSIHTRSNPHHVIIISSDTFHEWRWYLETRRGLHRRHPPTRSKLLIEQSDAVLQRKQLCRTNLTLSPLSGGPIQTSLTPFSISSVV